jgi:hypothetical protein
MVDDQALVNDLIAEGEGQTVEFKKADILSDTTKFAELMTAFSNSIGGRILVGVCDDGTIEGMKSKKEHELHVMNIARDRCDPPLSPSFSIVRKPEGDVYLIKVPRYRVLPHAVKTSEVRAYFIRVGTTVRGVTPSELALLFEAGRPEPIKRPRLELSLVDTSGSLTNSILAQPTIVKVQKIRTTEASSPLYFASLLPKIALPSSLFVEREPSPDLVPIDIEVSNSGEALAEGIRIWLHFPGGCELVSEHEATRKLTAVPRRSFGGLYVDDEDETVARAWIDILGNDVSLRLDRVYVRFPEREETFNIEAKVTLHNFPPETFRFSVTIKPVIRYEKQYVLEDDQDPKEK